MGRQVGLYEANQYQHFAGRWRTPEGGRSLSYCDYRPAGRERNGKVWDEIDGMQLLWTKASNPTDKVRDKVYSRYAEAFQLQS